MKINPATRKRKLLYSMGAAVVMVSCQQQQQQRLGGVPLPPPGVQPEEPVVKPQEETENTRPQRLGGRMKQMMPGVRQQPLPGKKRASR